MKTERVEIRVEPWLKELYERQASARDMGVAQWVRSVLRAQIPVKELINAQLANATHHNS